MSGGYRELENITADLGLEAWGADIEDAFVWTARGLAVLMSDLPPGTRSLTHRIHIKSDSLPGLLVGFLNEIVYLEETEGFLLADTENVKISGNRLDATLTGALFDPEKHSINAHIKAATYHGLEIDQSGDTVRIKIIFDV